MVVATVNASYIQTSHSNKRYIATQAPIPTTFNDFWRVIWEQDVRVIVMLTAESEGCQLKCHPYWRTADYGPFKVKALSERHVHLGLTEKNRHRSQKRPSIQRRSTNPHTAVEKNIAIGEWDAPDQSPFAIVRHLTLSHSDFPFHPAREITQLQYSLWPDFGTTTKPGHLVQLIEEFNKVTKDANGRGSRLDSNEPEPEGQPKVVVHCSAGCGRTGTFCTVDSVIDMLKRQRCKSSVRAGSEDDWVHRDDIDLIANTVEDFRSQRLSMVQTLRQFVLCYESVLEWIVSQRLDRGRDGGDCTRSTSNSVACSVRPGGRPEARRSYHG